jgi:hypothetical protein
MSTVLSFKMKPWIGGFMRIGLAALSLGFLCASSVFATNIVLNPGFETGDFTNWTSISGFNVDTTSDGVVAHSGAFYADTGCVGATCIAGPNAATFSQTLTTVAGQNYTFSFFYDLGDTTCSGCSEGPSGDPADIFAELVAQWNGATVLDVVSTDTPESGYVLFSVNEIASSTSSTIQFFGRQDPAQLGVDDVCVDLAGGTCPVAGQSGVPEPGSMFLLGGGIAVLALLGARRRARA